ncbi:MAG: outer membrane lipoprotein-sorting protein [Fimbriimonadaceae bacterium]|nr:outer membrane lipoprotein-sorting protein [Fimbriimonadaceae bacterium]
MTTLIATLALLAPSGAADPTSDDIASVGFKDASFVARVKVGNQNELNKINKDFGQSYRFKWTKVQVKEPFKLRLESTVDDTDITFVLNGATRLLRVPKARISNRENLAKSPGKRQTLLDFGIITPSLFADLFNAKFVRVDRRTNDLVFDLTYKPSLDDTSRHRVWVDPEKRYVTRREWYAQNERQLATFYYEEPKQQNGVWFPTRLTVRNAEDKVAGVTNYEELKLNSGIADSVFAVN